MIVNRDLSLEILDTNSHHWNFENYENDDGNMLVLGINSLFKKNSDFIKKKLDSKIVLFNNWAPCEYSQRNLKKGINALVNEEKFDYILTICPYTAEWRNLNSENKKYIYAFYPFSTDIIPKANEKQYDVIYHGGIHGKEHIMAMNVILKKNYRYTTLDYGINQLTRNYLKYATDINLPFNKKIELVAKSKISICFNLIHVSLKHFWNINKYRSSLRRGGEFFNNLSSFGIIKNYPWIGILPQFKTRIHEAAISNCINLVYRDPWNIIEDYYEPDKEFIYFSNENELRLKIDHIVKNWNSTEIQDIANAAYKKSMKFTSKNFMDTYSKVVRLDNPINYLSHAKKFYKYL